MLILHGPSTVLVDGYAVRPGICYIEFWGGNDSHNGKAVIIAQSAHGLRKLQTFWF